MAKLTGAKKKAFLERMAKGRRKAARGTGRKKAKAKRPAAKKNPRRPPKKKTAVKKHAAKKRTNPSVRRSKKVIGKGFSRPVAAEWAKEKRAKARKAKKRRAVNPSKRRRNSGAEEAAAMFETFHQMAPKRIIDYEEIVRFPGNFAEIGLPLKELRVYLDDANPDFPLTRFGDCQVVCTPDGSNIYFVGGDQSLDLNSLDITSDKDTIELGPCTYIMYHTVKGFHDFEPVDYWHRFGEEDGVFPRLGYDRLNKRLFLIGGNYQAKREGIVN